MTTAIAYLGPQGTFTESAARLVTASSDADELLPCGDVIEVLRAVEVGDAERGVVPIENTLEGSVTATLDALAFDTDLLISGELELPVALVAAAREAVSLDEVAEVHSHPVALSACRRWLSKSLGGAERLEAASTARAAATVAEVGGPRLAIVNPLAAERYGLEVVARDIADRSGNSTRFVVVGRTLPAPTGWDKTSVVVFIEENRPGALLQLLEIFAERELNLTKIESRPTKHELGEYCFFLDVEGHLADERVGDALAAVKRTHRDVKLLGSYRRSGARRTTEAERIAADDAAYRDAAGWLADWRGRIDRSATPPVDPTEVATAVRNARTGG
ncbi:prephenate dehydratase [Egicoccus halophilus]|uniref:Prephenate dehydratase n=1 Tax=Egicoccus halophilus TaxID=1670830 RepID=A0A8J3ACA4_9ACTN|nr:prephenate dehydratase [Egicoccus halophilus]GGI03439.1 chorismate mutase [Egicoccus halophilus]